MKLQCVLICEFFREIATFISRLSLFNKFFPKRTAIYGANLRGSVFRLISGVLDTEFESIETSSGFARLLGKKWGFRMVLGKKMLNDKSINMNIVISRKKVELCLRSQRKLKTNENPVILQCAYVTK